MMPKSKRLHIVVADDDACYRALARCLLSKADCLVAEAADGSQVMPLINEHTDVLVTDVVMPGQEGIATIIEVRRRHPHVKIVAVSGVANGHSYLDMAKMLGASATLPKAETRDRLVRVIEELTGVAASPETVRFLSNSA